MSHVHVAAALPALPATRPELDTVDTAQWQAVLTAEPAEALAWMTAAARLGHAPSQALVGQWLLDGHGQPRDAVAALHWFQRAAQQGHPMGMNMLGRCHDQGWGTPVDPGKAAHWWRAALRTPLPEARYNLANLLAAGRGVARDQAQAHALYREAADAGYVKAFAKLGRYHEDGLVVPQDAALALDCYRRGAEGGDFRGQFAYAGMLAAQGRETEALHWLERVPARATPAFLHEAGVLLLQSPSPRIRAVGERMLALRAAAAGA